MDKGTAEAYIFCFSLDYTLRGQQKNRPTNISAGVLTLLLTSGHVCLPRSTVHTPFTKGESFEELLASMPLVGLLLQTRKQKDRV